MQDINIKQVAAFVIIIFAAASARFIYTTNIEQAPTIPVNPTADLTYITIGEDGTNCVVTIPSSVEENLAELGVYKWLAACQERYGD